MQFIYQNLHKRKMVLWGLFMVYILVVFYITIFSREPAVTMQAKLLPFRPFIQGILYPRSIEDAIAKWNAGGFLAVFRVVGKKAFRDMWLNILMFVPFGILLPMICDKMTRKKVGMYAFALSALIEGIQFVSKRGCLETDDLLTNVLGAVIGINLVIHWTKSQGKEKAEKSI